MSIQITISDSLSPSQVLALDLMLMEAIARGELLSLIRFQYRPHYKKVASILAKNRGVIALALDGNTIVGSMYAHFPNFPTQTDKAKFHKLLVLPSYRDQGIASRLFVALEAEVKKRGKTKVWFYYHQDNPAKALYEKLGYKTMFRPNPLRPWVRVDKLL